MDNQDREKAVDKIIALYGCKVNKKGKVLDKDINQATSAILALMGVGISEKDIENFLLTWGKENKAFQKNAGFRKKLATALASLVNGRKEGR